MTIVSKFFDRKIQILFAVCRTRKVMNGTDQRDTVLLHIVQYYGERIAFCTFRTEIFISGNCPFCPAIGRFGIIGTFHAGKI